MGKAYKQNDLWVVEISDADWYAKGVNQEALKRAYLDDARRNKCVLCAVFVTPDAVFPLYGYTARHKVFEHRFPSKHREYNVEVLFTGVIDSEVYSNANVSAQMSIVRKVRDALNMKALTADLSGRYLIKTSDNKLIEQGRV